jgi:hypothetical protein
MVPLSCLSRTLNKRNVIRVNYGISFGSTFRLAVVYAGTARERFTDEEAFR